MPNALSPDDPPPTVPLAPFHWDLHAQEASIICSTPGNVNISVFGSVTKYGFEQAVKYLEDLGSQPRMDAGPASCSRVSCSHWTAVFLCNDAKASKTLESWTVVANALKALRDRCGIFPLTDWPLGGQIFYKAGWNVILPLASQAA
ncbi:hypothetical protein PCL_07447 [Purpureocillium lilacinum]|uniref:Uncharacterized protein n=1 Tax=Purpureocillium lilacinum TaxID=33203 RepID=A0A2U3DS24_PURLI|nr:hypothetical protein PCL_07447 [Purpureocillium lilacinum]